MNLRGLARALPLLLALASGPALADVTASYRVGTERLTVEVAGNGDARVEAEQITYIRHGHDEYLVLGRGEEAMAGRKRDMLAFLAKMLLHADPDLAAGPASRPIAPAQEALPASELLGMPITNWRILPYGKEAGAKGVEAGFSDASQLAPAGEVLRELAEALVDVLGPMDKNGNFRSIVAAMRAHGTLVSVGGSKPLQLEAMRTDPVDPSHFAAPERLLSPEMLDALADEMGDRGKEKR